MNSFMSFLAQAPAAPVEAAAAVAQPAAGMTPMQYIFGFVYMGVCLFLILAILSRTTKNEGLSGSMMGGGDSSFRGAKSTDDTIDTITNGVAAAFVFLSIALNYAF
jgi:protein translocase SecG subunit